MTGRASVVLLSLYLAGALVSAVTQDMLMGVSRGTLWAQQSAPIDAPYIVSSPNGTLTGEVSLSLLSTGLLKVTTGTGALTIATAPTDFVATGDSRLSDARTPTAHTHGDADLTSSYSGVGACGANTWASTLNDNAAPTCTQPAFTSVSGSVTDAQVPNTITLDNLTQVTTRAIGDTTGTLAVSRGGTNLTAEADDNTIVGNGTTWETRAIGSCSGASNALTYNTTTNAYGCNTISGGSGPTTITASSDASDAVIATLTAIPGLSFTPAATTNYLIDCYVLYTSTVTTTGISFAWDTPSSPTRIVMSGYTPINANTGGTFHQRADNTNVGITTATQAVGPAEFLAVLHTLFQNGSTSATMSLGFTPETANSVTVKAGSVCQYRTF